MLFGICRAFCSSFMLFGICRAFLLIFHALCHLSRLRTSSFFAHLSCSLAFVELFCSSFMLFGICRAFLLIFHALWHLSSFFAHFSCSLAFVELFCSSLFWLSNLKLLNLELRFLLVKRSLFSWTFKPFNTSLKGFRHLFRF